MSNLFRRRLEAKSDGRVAIGNTSSDTQLFCTSMMYSGTLGFSMSFRHLKSLGMLEKFSRKHIHVEK